MPVTSSSPLKQHLSGESFPDDNEVESAVCAEFRQQPQEFYGAGSQGLVKWWDKCLNLFGDYIEKEFCFYVIIPIRLFSITVCNLLIDLPSYNSLIFLHIFGINEISIGTFFVQWQLSIVHGSCYRNFIHSYTQAAKQQISTYIPTTALWFNTTI